MTLDSLLLVVIASVVCCVGQSICLNMGDDNTANLSWQMKWMVLALAEAVWVLEVFRLWVPSKKAKVTE